MTIEPWSKRVHSMTDPSGHMFASTDKIRICAEAIDQPLTMPIGRETALHQAGAIMRDTAADLNTLARHLLGAKRDLSPDTIRMMDMLEAQFKALNPPWITKAREL